MYNVMQNAIQPLYALNTTHLLFKIQEYYNFPR